MAINNGCCVTGFVPKGITVRLVLFALKFIRVNYIHNVLCAVAGGNFFDLAGDDDAGCLIPVPRIDTLEEGFSKV
jgi:hypothetical protein